MLKKYKMGFDIWGLVVFLIIMIPNFIWFIIPAPNDILRADSATTAVDAVASICQVLVVITLCFFINQERKNISITPLILTVMTCCLLYFASWVFYYIGMTNAIIIFGLTVPPCLTLLFFAIDRKNMIAVIPITIFTVCHFIYGIVNFIS